MKRIVRIVSALLLVLAAAGPGRAVTLDILLNGGSITAGDKLFDNWNVSFYDSSEGRTFNAANIDVQALDDGGMDPGPGLLFSVSNGELTVTGDDILGYVDLQFGFRASVLDPGLLIKDNTLKYGDLGGAFWSISVDDSYNAGSSIWEFIGSAPGQDELGIKDIEFSVLLNEQGVQEQFSKVADSADFAPQSQIWVKKNILVWATDATDSAGILGFEQRFSQTVVPEPGTAVLLGSGLLGAALVRRKKK